jgi:hypothetical protein
MKIKVSKLAEASTVKNGASRTVVKNRTVVVNRTVVTN